MGNGLQDLPIPEILEIARRNGAMSVSVFGSRSRGDARPDSDLDLLVDVVPGTSLFDIGRMYVELNELLEIRVDVVTPGGLHPRMRDEVLREAQRLDAAA